MTHEPRRTALILMGGGARAAYQIGVLDGIWHTLVEAGWPAERNPFGILCGTSAGAINAAALAGHAHHFDRGVRELYRIWSTISADRVYRNDASGSLLHAASWLGSLMFGWLARHAPRSMFDNTPLSALLAQSIDFAALHEAIRDGTVTALSVTASSYTSGQHVTFYETQQPVAPWYRSQRLATPSRIEPRHLLASAAIPFLFPAVPLPLGDHQEFFGDGSMRQTAPLAPAIHLGAHRLLVIGAGQIETASANEAPRGSQFLYPSLGQIAGHAMSGIFLDALANDIERTERVNRTLALLTPEQRALTSLYPLDVLAISPSQRLDLMAPPHLHELARPIRALLHILGATDRRSASLMSYLLFEAGYVQELLDLGRRDALAQRERILAFFQMSEARTRPDASLTA
ncbi:MAG: patatin-like phospholipase family protein [Burkholderiaceae bacterium]